MPQPFVIGVDGGATKSVAWLASTARDGAVLGRGVSGPANPRAVGFTEAQRHIDAAIQEAFADAGMPRRPASAAALALAGAGRAEEQSEMHAWAVKSGLASRVLVTDDAESVLAAAGHGSGIALICGTGSLAWGRNESGETARVGGWGHLLGDEGSAYAMALAGLRVAVRAADGRGAPSLLLTRFQEALDARTPEEFIGRIYRTDLTHDRLAALASVVFDTAASDRPAQAIVDAAAGDLAGMVSTLVDRLGLQPHGFALVLAGGVLVNQPSLQAGVAARLAAWSLVPTSIHVVPEPVVGAVALARRTLVA